MAEGKRIAGLVDYQVHVLMYVPIMAIIIIGDYLTWSNVISWKSPEVGEKGIHESAASP